MSEDMPTFEHDCDKCVYLGALIDERVHDLYFCYQSGRPTVIARYGSDGPDYISGIVFRTTNGPIAVAYCRAVERGLIAGKEGIEDDRTT